ncbi:MAG: anti-sigma factor [Anaeromyxobacteraceae bacterium]
MSATNAGLTCEEVLALLSDYLDGELSPVDLGKVEAHLSACDGCTKFGGQFRATVGALRSHLRSAAGPRLPDRIRARLDALLAEKPKAPKE